MGRSGAADSPEGWYRAIVEAAPDAIVLADAEGRIREVNPQAERMFGYGSDELLGQPVEILVPDEVRDRHREHRRRYMEHPRTRPMGVGMELRGRRKDGTTLPVEISLSPLDEAGEPLVISVIRDVTEHRRLRNFGLGAVRATEDERQRIARELHDDTGQALSALLLRLGVARRAGEGPVPRDFLDEVRERIGEVVDGVRRISRGLRPPALDDAGVEVALRGHLRAVGRNSGVDADIQFSSEPVDRLLGPEAKLVLYRVVQEAVSNALRHAGASTIRVDLKEGPEEVHARVQDDGCGFDPAHPRILETGLGITGMRERAGLVGGELRIESRPGEGTTVHLSIPVTQPGPTHV